MQFLVSWGFRSLAAAWIVFFVLWGLGLTYDLRGDTVEPQTIIVDDGAPI